MIGSFISGIIFILMGLAVGFVFHFSALGILMMVVQMIFGGILIWRAMTPFSFVG